MEKSRLILGLMKALETIDEEYPSLVNTKLFDMFHDNKDAGGIDNRTVLDLFRETYNYGKKKYGVKKEKISMLVLMAYFLNLAHGDSTKLEITMAVAGLNCKMDKVNRFINEEKYDEKELLASAFILKVYGELYGMLVKSDFIEELEELKKQRKSKGND